MKKILALSLLAACMAGGWMTRKSTVAFDGPIPPPQCIPGHCPPGK